MTDQDVKNELKRLQDMYHGEQEVNDLLAKVFAKCDTVAETRQKLTHEEVEELFKGIEPAIQLKARRRLVAGGFNFEFTPQCKEGFLSWRRR